MAVQRKFSFIVKPGLVVLGLILIRCAQPSTAEIAGINSASISADEFATRYSKFLSFASQTDNLLNRIQYLDAMIDEELLIQTAGHHRWDRTPEWLEGFNRLRDQLLLNAVYEQDLAPDLTVDEAELRTLYRWSKQRLHVRHLFARTRAGIDSLSNRLKEGVPWEELAKTAFRDPRLAGNGGDLGWVSLGDLDPPFEQAAYRLPDGDVSAPVRTSTGWSLIQVTEREKDPFLIESEFQWRRKRLERIAKSYLKAPQVRSYTDQVADALQLTFDRDRLSIVRELLPSLTGHGEAPVQNADSPCFYAGDRDKTYTVGETLALLQTLSPRQRAQATTIENLQSIITGILVRQKLLERGRALGLDRKPSFQKAFAQARKSFIVRQTFSRITGQVSSADPDSLIVLRRKRYLTFRDSLKKHSQIEINRQLLKTLPISVN
ncbi:MAG: peptidylprolyl isomerase [Fidelibacterota bacterium]